MKLLVLMAVFFCTVVGFSQKIYPAKGELQFINPDKGLVMKGDRGFYILNIYPYFDRNDGVIFRFKEEIIALNAATFDSIRQNRNNIPRQKIGKLNSRQLDRMCFHTKDDEETADLYQVTQNIFAASKQDNEEKASIQSCIDEVFSYFTIEFSDGLKVGQLEYSAFIVPTNNKLQIVDIHRKQKNFNDVVFSSNYYFSTGFANAKTKKKSLKPCQIELHTRLNEYFSVDTTAARKVFLRNNSDTENPNMLAKTFDSIAMSSFIVGYDKGIPELYNYSFKKLKLPGLRAVKYSWANPSAQVLQHNKIKYIDIFGKTLKKKDTFYPIFGDEVISGEDNTFLTISKNDNDFYLFAGSQDTLRLSGTNDTKDISFFNDKSGHNTEMVYSEASLKIYLRPLQNLIVAIISNDENIKLDYLFRYIDRTQTQDAFSEIEENVRYDLSNLTGLQFAQKVSGGDIGLWKLKQNNLWMYFPLQQSFRYKKLGDFDGSFARFELPNGQKGWLDKKGKEYFDE